MIPKHESQSVSALRPLFIGGTGRSGTTVLKRLLREHSNIVGVDPELRFIVDPDGLLDLFSTLNDHWDPYSGHVAAARFHDLIRRMSREKSQAGLVGAVAARRLGRSIRISPPAYLGCGVGRAFGKATFRSVFDRFLGELVVSRSKAIWNGTPGLSLGPHFLETRHLTWDGAAELVSPVFDALYHRIAAAENRNAKASFWVDDTPHNLLHANRLAKLFPSLRLIHIYRDPRDVVASSRTFSWAGSRYTDVAMRIREQLERWSAVRAELNDTQYLELSLEELLLNRHDVLRRLFDFLDLPMDDAVLSIPLGSGNVGRWKKQFGEEERQEVERTLRRWIVPSAESSRDHEI